MKNKEQRKYIREALRVVEITKQDKNYSDGRFDYIIEILKLSDDVVKKLIIPIVSQQSELLLSFYEHIHREYNIEDDTTFGEVYETFNATNLINW